jgi:hypothetical protein
VRAEKSLLQPAFGNLRLSAKRLEAIVPQTRELLMSTKYSADELFAADLSRRMQLGLDWGALYGTGGEFQPTGIANTPGVEKIDAKKMDAQYAADGKLTADFPVYVKSLVMSKNVDDQALAGLSTPLWRAISRTSRPPPATTSTATR